MKQSIFIPSVSVVSACFCYLFPDNFDMWDISWDDEAVTTKLCNMMSSLEIVLMNVILLTGPYFPMSQFSGNWEP